jgi:hypothetical protein
MVLHFGSVVGFGTLLRFYCIEKYTIFIKKLFIYIAIMSASVPIPILEGDIIRYYPLCDADQHYVSIVLNGRIKPLGLCNTVYDSVIDWLKELPKNGRVYINDRNEFHKKLLDEQILYLEKNKQRWDNLQIK